MVLMRMVMRPMLCEQCDNELMQKNKNKMKKLNGNLPKTFHRTIQFERHEFFENKIKYVLSLMFSSLFNVIIIKKQISKAIN